MSIVSKQPYLGPASSRLYTSDIAATWMIIGIGNPGRSFAQNRHNTGFMCLDHLAQAYQVNWKTKPALKSNLAQIQIGDNRILLLKPQTYVNLSGEAAALSMQFYKLSPKQLYIIHDDVRHPFGLIVSHSSEQARGHNGLKSIKSSLKIDTLQLISVGIGPKQPESASLSSFVLGNFTESEQDKLKNIIKEVCSLVGEINQSGISPDRRQI